MSTGARSTDQWREHRALLEAIQRGGPIIDPPPAPSAPPPEPELDDAPASLVERIGGIALLILGCLWIAAIVTSLQAEAAPVAALAARVSLASGPLALLGIAYLLLQRTSRRQANRFGRTAAAMRGEATALEATVGKLAERIDDSRKAVAEHAQQLLALGEDSALRLAEIGAAMRSETKALTRQSEQLESAAAIAASDLGVLIADLPRLEGQVHSIATALRGVGRDADDRLAFLSAEMVRLADRAREVDEVAGGAAQRLSAHLARIEGISDAAGNRIDAAAAGIARTVDSALTSAAEAVEATRASIDTQSDALLAMVDQARAAFARAGGEAAQSLEGRLDAAAAKAETLGTRLAEHDAAGRALLDALGERIAELDRALVDADATGTARAVALAAALRSLGEDAARLGGTLDRGGEAADALVARGERLQAVVAACVGALGDRLPTLIAEIEADAGRSGKALETLLPQAGALANGVAATGRSLATIERKVASQRAAIDGLAGAADDQLTHLEQRGKAVETLLADTAERAAALTAGAAPQLVEALLRVRETANQAADHAARTLGGVVQAAAARLGEESGRVLDERLGTAVESRLGAIAAAADRAVAAAEGASRRLADELTLIAATTSAAEKRIADAHNAEGAKSEDAVSARVAHLIEELNSAAVDVTALLSTDVPDTLWAAYLKGDRGIFTRRAARLVDAADAKEIARRYQQEPAFRDQVNRYIHDFEAMLRHILATRDGSLLGVTLLSADMGKLYVALAQAIERLRA